MTAAETVLEFLARINRRDVDALAELMSEDHVFVDSLGNAVRGREKMRAGWRGYYAMRPDYWVTPNSMMADAAAVAVFGEAGGTIAGTAWRIPAAWRAVVEDGLIAEWRVYADNKPVYEILAKAARTSAG